MHVHLEEHRLELALLDEACEQPQHAVRHLRQYMVHYIVHYMVQHAVCHLRRVGVVP